MPIKKARRGFYPIDWRELSAVIRFERAKGRCERPNGNIISTSATAHLEDQRMQSIGA